jgi:hypothetical protein
VSAIVTAGALPGCRIAPLRPLTGIAGLPFPMNVRVALLGAMRALRRGQSHLRQAENAQHQHQKTHNPPRWGSESSTRPTSHTGSIASHQLPCKTNSLLLQLSLIKDVGD